MPRLDAEHIWLAGDTVLVAFHGAWTDRRTAARSRVRGMLAIELDPERRIQRARAWALTRDRRHRLDPSHRPANPPARIHRQGGSVAGEVSFDVVSDFDRQELVNALDQVRREVGTRYDFKNVTVDLQLGKEEISLLTDDEYRAAAVKDLIESKAIRRGLSLKIFDWGTIEPAGGSKVKQIIKLRRGLPEDLAKKISKLIRDDYPKCHAQIQGDAVRVSSKSKDDLQKVIARLREEGEGYPVPLQFQNYR